MPSSRNKKTVERYLDGFRRSDHDPPTDAGVPSRPGQALARGEQQASW